MALVEEFIGVSFVECAHDEKDDVVDHVAVSQVIQELAQWCNSVCFKGSN
jgi:hypothetical protein